MNAPKPIDKVALTEILTAKHDKPGRRWEHSNLRMHYDYINDANRDGRPCSFQEMLREAIAHRECIDVVDRARANG